MDRIFTEVNPTLQKKINENINLFKEYPKTAFRENPMEGIQNKLKKSIKEMNG